MKRLLFAIAILALVFSGVAAVKADDVSVDFFYNNLSGGNWIEVGDYGYCWQPDAAANDPAWRPYSDGYWAYTDDGWTWVSYEDFGWATYHYGRWARLADYGWVWVPGRDEDLEWGPAWVSWRTGGEYIGWAPLPPETMAMVEGRPIEGDLDVEFNIGPAYYNFVDVRYIGEPVLRERIVDYRQNVTYINETLNVTNITYKNKVVYNYGPDLNVVNGRAARPIQRLKLERQENGDLNAAAKAGGLVKPQGDKLIVAAPMHIRKAERQEAPPTVKTKIATPNLDRGWSVVGDEKAQTEFKERLKSQQDRKAEILAGATGKTGTAGQAAISPKTGSGAAAASGSLPAVPLEKGKSRNRDRVNEQSNSAANSGANAAPANGFSPNDSGTESERGRGRGKNAEGFQTNAPGAAITTSSPGGSGSTSPENSPKGGGRRSRQGVEGQPQQSSPIGQNKPSDPSGRQQGGRRGRGSEQSGQQANGTASGDSQNQNQTGGGRGEHGMDAGHGQSQSPAVSDGQGQGDGQRQRDNGRKQEEQSSSPAPTP